MDVDGVTTPPRKRPLASSKVGSISLGRRIALGAVGLGIPLMAFGLFFALQPGPSSDAGSGDAAMEGEEGGLGGEGLPDPPLDDGALPAQDFDGDGVPDVDGPGVGNLTDDPGLP